MMAKTHLTVGIASALAVCSIVSPDECAAAVAGGALGGILADVDILDNDYRHDALIGELIAFGITAVAALLDYCFHWGICSSLNGRKIASIIGAVAFAVLWGIGFSTDHRNFTHSLLAMFLFSVALGMIYIPFGIACLVGYSSHLILDITNKKGIQLFFPAEANLCLRWFYAGKTANTVFMWLGFAAAVVLLFYRMMMLIGVA